MKFGRYISMVVLTACLSLMGSNTAAEQNPGKKGRESETVLVRNVTLLNQEGEAEDVVVNILVSDNPGFKGYYITGAWALTGEMRTYNHKSGSFSPLPVAKSVYQGGAGAWEAAVRWSDIDLADSAVDGGEMQIFSLGLDWWLNSFFCFNANYRHITLDRFDERGQSDGLMTRLLLILE